MLFRPPRSRLLTVVFIFFVAGVLFFKINKNEQISVHPSEFFADRYSTLAGIYNPNAKGAGEIVQSTTTTVAPSSPTPTAVAASSTREKPNSSIVEFWDYWSVVFDSARPPEPKIKLRKDAVSKRPTKEQEAFGFREPVESFTNMTTEQIDSMRKSHAVVRKKLEGMKYKSSDLFKGTGVVIVAGGEFFGPAIVGIRMLRRTGSKLPVEIFLYKEEEYEAKVCEEVLPKLNAKCRVLNDFINTNSAPAQDFGEVNNSPVFKFEKYQLKVMALLLSSFEDVLFLDSDSIPLVNPEKELFDTVPFKETGMIVYPDFWYATEDPVFYDIAGVPGGFPKKTLPPTSTESGQFLFSKKKHLDSLLLAAYYNIYGPKWFYPLLSQGAAGQGDKETFLAAAAVLGKPFHRVKTKVGVVGYKKKGEYKGTGMVQYSVLDDLDAYGTNPTINKTDVRPAFVHENLPKLNAGALFRKNDHRQHITDAEGKPMRMWGPKEANVKRFGRDLEKEVWEELVGSGCELEGVIKNWKKTENLCDKLKAHWDGLFAKDGEDGEKKTTTTRRKRRRYVGIS